MKTTYLTTLTASFNPFSRTAVVPRLILSLLKPDAHKTIAIKSIQLPRSSTQPASLVLGFKDGKTLKYLWAEDEVGKSAATERNTKKKSVKLQDIVEEVERHTRILGRKEELAG